MMSMAWLPQWLRILWSVALLAVVALHIWHAWAHAGQPRWWHCGHTVMALGMIWMYLALPTMTQPGTARVVLVLFAACTAAMLATAVICWRREHVLNPLWLASAADMLAMVAMLVPAMVRPSGVTWIAVAYLGAQTLAWASGAWGHLQLYRQCASPPAQPGAAGAPPGSVASAPSEASAPPRVGLSGRTTIDVRLTLAIMNASMAYMLAVM